MNNEYKLSHRIILRIVQILQEAIITGTDISDLLIDMKLVVGEDGSTLDLSENYLKEVEKWHEDLLENAKKQAALQGIRLDNEEESEGKIIV